MASRIHLLKADFSTQRAGLRFQLLALPLFYLNISNYGKSSFGFGPHILVFTGHSGTWRPAEKNLIVYKEKP